MFNAIKELNAGINKIFFTTRDTEHVIDEVFQDMGLGKNTSELKYLSNNFFQCKQKDCITPVLSSYCLLLDGTAKKDSFLLKTLPRKIAYLNSEYEKNKSVHGSKSLSVPSTYSSSLRSDEDQAKYYTIDIPDSIKISNHCKLFIRDSIINIHDFQLNKNVTIYLNHNFKTVKKIMVIKMKDINASSFMKSECIDTAFYKSVFPRIHRMGIDVPSIASTFISDSTVSLMVTLLCPRYPDPNTFDSLRLNRKTSKFTVHDTILDMKYFIYSQNLTTNKIKIQCINKVAYQEDKYWILSLPFILEKNKLFASIHNWDNAKDENFLAEFKLTNNIFEFKHLRVNNNKNIKIENIKAKETLQRDINSNYYFTTALPFVFDYRKNKDFIFDKNEFLVSDKLYIHDVFGVGEKIYFIASENAQYFHYTLNINTGKRESKTQINLDISTKSKEIKFLDANRYLLLDGNKIYIIGK